MGEYYVYCYLDNLKPGCYTYDNLDICFTYEPIYVGKGKSNRIFEHLKNYELNNERRVKHNPLKNKRIKSIIEKGLTPICFKLWENLSNETANELEIGLIGKIGRIVDKTGSLTNLSDGGEGGDNMKYLTDERKTKIYSDLSKRFKGQKYLGPEKGNIIYQYNLDGLFIREWRSITKASKALNIHKYMIIKNVKGEGYKSAGGFIFKDFKTEKIDPIKRNEKSVIQLSMDGDVIKIWESMTEAAEKLNIRGTGISSCCNGNYKHSGGFKWKYNENMTKEELRKLFSKSDWNETTINEFDKIISRISKDYLGLDVYPNQFEIVSSEQLLDAYALIGLPVSYDHWKFGKEYVINQNNYKKGKMGLSYEMVINTDSCISYNLEDNDTCLMVLVYAHVQGHNHFFKNNYLFKQWTQADSIIDYMLFAKNYVKKCEEKYGYNEVESVLDACHALMN